MVIKTFNVEESVYKRFSKMCKENGISMSKQVDLFMRSMIEQEPKAKKEFLARLDRIREGPFISVKDFAKKYNL